MAREKQWYVYGLCGPGLPARLTVLGHALRGLPIARRASSTRSEIVAIVEPVAARVEPTIENLQTQHEIVTRLAARVPALIPARVGSTMSERALRERVAAHDADIRDALRRVDACAQMTIRVFGPSDLPAPAASRAASGTAFLEQRRARAHYVPAEVDVIREQLGAHARAERVEPGERTLRVTVFHLVPRDSVEAYRQRASALQAMLAPRQVTVSGPAPAFAFAPELW
jgi:hypothetical protein